MNNQERFLIRYVCDGDIRQSQKQARIILNELTAKKDEQFKADMLRKLNSKASFIEIPSNLKNLLVAEDVENFPSARFLLREQEEAAVERVLDLYKASEQLAEKGIPYLPALILHGESGCGKTMLARYIAHKAELPFVYVQFSNLVESFLGKTQSNVAKVFDFVRSAPCVLCFDEIDAIGMARGQKDDVGEMNRVVIALMQELDRMPNDVIIIGTTNRYDRLDPALVRRFPLEYKLHFLQQDEIEQMARKFFTYADVECASWVREWCRNTFDSQAPASSVVRECTQVVVNQILYRTKEELHES